MKRHIRTWFIFAVFAGAVLSGMGWLTVRLLELSRENTETRRRVWIERAVRDALWRMDADMSSMILEEASRPYSDYWAFNDQGEVLHQPSPEQIGQVSVSPLLSSNDATKNLYFQAELWAATNGVAMTSPQVVNSEQIANSVNWSQDMEAGNRRQLQVLNGSVSVEDIKDALARAEENEQQEDADIANAVPVQTLQEVQAMNDAVSQQAAVQSDESQQQVWAGDYQYGQRKSEARQVFSKIQTSKTRMYNLGKKGSDDYSGGREVAAGGVLQGTGLSGKDKMSLAVSEEVMRPIWVRDFLMLARTVDVGGQKTIQGVWLNWDNIRRRLLGHVTDVFPDADLVKADPTDVEDRSRMLASLPVKLVPGNPLEAGMPAGRVFRVPLTIAWIAVAAGIAAVGGLIAGISVLSERRGDFVSAVTHELRTPLTTLRMYTEMLKEGIVSGESSRREYIETLHSESERLGHLVENVLAYARLEKGTGSRILEEVTAAAIVERAGETLRRRGDEARMEVVTDVGSDAGVACLKTDVTAVVQILFNLVDNACKYASKAQDRRIHVAVSRGRGEVLFKVSDHGEGLRRDELRTVFKPFRKSAEKAAQTAPGVGLGLALCRRLARQLGGDVDYETHREYGACFVLRLPSA